MGPILVQSWEGSKGHYPELCSERIYPLGREQQGVGRKVGSSEISQHLVSFPVKSLPWFISNWEKGPSVAQPVENAGSLWEEGV